MKYLITTLFILVIFASCNKKEYHATKTVEYPYMRLWALTICGSDFDYKEDSPKEWEDKVLDSLNSKGFEIIEHHLGFIKQEPFLGCGNCRRTGDFLDVIVPKNQREKLKKLGFEE